MLRSALLLILTLAISAVCLAETPPDRKTSLKVYHVGNIASSRAMKAGLGGKSTSDEWASEHAETTNALGEIQELVECLCEEKPLVVKVYTPSLSLVVRSTESGHKEVEQILQELGGTRETLIQMEYRAVAAFEGSDEASGSRASLTEAERLRFAILNCKSQLTKAETSEMNALSDRVPFGDFKETVVLKPGHRTPWGDPFWPTTAMARWNRDKQTIDIRIDAIADDLGEVTPTCTRVLSLAEGESARTMHPHDGHMAVWRITAKVVSQQPPPVSAVASNPTVAPLIDEDQGVQELPMVMSRRFASNGTDSENAREEVRARLVLHDHQVKYGEGVYSLGVEFENLSMTDYARIEFNSMDPKLELFDAQDRAIPEGEKIRTGPVPHTQVAIIPPGSFVVLSTHDPGIGLNGEKKRLGAGGQVWKLATGTYRLRGTIPARVQFEKPRFDEAQRGTALPPDKWPAAGEKENLAIPLSTFTIP